MKLEARADEHEFVIRGNARYGLILFAIYFALYAGFIVLAVFKAPLMGTPVFGGLNLAIAYGFVLIISALVLALIYMALCRDIAEENQD